MKYNQSMRMCLPKDRHSLTVDTGTTGSVEIRGMPKFTKGIKGSDIGDGFEMTNNLDTSNSSEISNSLDLSNSLETHKILDVHSEISTLKDLLLFFVQTLLLYAGITFILTFVKYIPRL